MIYRSLRDLQARNRKKVSKKILLGGLQTSPQKYPKKSKNTNIRTFSGHFARLLDFSRAAILNGTFRADPPKDLV